MPARTQKTTLLAVSGFNTQMHPANEQKARVAQNKRQKRAKQGRKGENAKITKKVGKIR